MRGNVHTDHSGSFGVSVCLLVAIVCVYLRDVPSMFFLSCLSIHEGTSASFKNTSALFKRAELPLRDVYRAKDVETFVVFLQRSRLIDLHQYTASL